MGPSVSGVARAVAAVALMASALVVPGPEIAVVAAPSRLEQSVESQIQVTPSGLLAPGQTVTITPVGQPEGVYWVVAQCPVGAADTACGSRIGIASGPEQFTVRRTLYGGGVATDCSISPCELRVLGATVAPIPIEIDGAAPILRPSIAADPAVDLADNQVVSLSGSGFSSYSQYSAFQCAGFTCTETPTPMYSEENGELAQAGFVVQRTVGDVDCAESPGACTIVVSAPNHLDEFTGTPLTFDPEADPIPSPSAVATPSTQLLDGQIIEVTVSSTQSSSVFARQCTSDLDRCRWFAADEDEGSASEVTLAIEVGRRVGGLDCGVDACVIVVEVPPYAPIVIPIGFDTGTPPPPLPTLTVTPADDLTDLQTVAVEVTGIGDNDYFGLALCSQRATGFGRSCESVYSGDAEGTPFRASVRLPRLVSGYGYGNVDVVDCAVESCELVASFDVGGEYFELSTPVTFDPDAPFAPPPTARALPATGLWDRQVIEVRGSNFRPGFGVSVQQCAGDGGEAGSGTCTPFRFIDVEVGPIGELRLRTEVRRTFTSSSGDTADCLATGCSLVVRVGSASAVVPIEFAQTGTADAFPQQLECVAWPTNDWPKGELPLGVDVSELDAMAERAATDSTPYQSFVVIHGGEVVYEWYDAGTNATTLRASFSVSKSFTSTMAGLLIDDGVVSLDGPAPVPEWSDPDDPRHEISIRNLLNMSAGLEWDESYSFTADTDIIKMFASPDIGAYVANKPLVAPPGSQFRYSTGTTSLIARILAQESGKAGPEFEQLLFDRLFTPLGISDVSLGFDSVGTWYGGSQTNLSTLDFAKLGLLYLRGGVWEDEQFLPEGWADYVRTPAPSTSGYGAQFWLRDNGRFEMIGLFGQAVYIAPDLDLVVAVNNRATSTDEIASLFEDVEAPSCGDDPIVRDDAVRAIGASSTVIDVLANDPGRGEGMAAETLTIANPPTNGTVAVVDGALTYTTEATEGSDVFSYVACTESRVCGEATVDVTIAEPGDELVVDRGGVVERRAERCSITDC